MPAYTVAGMGQVLTTAEKWTPLSAKIVEERQVEHFRQATEPSLLSLITGMFNCTMAQPRDPETDV
jgi:hypothetical protein